MDKRGQMKISFGMIFSIILIIMFLSFAFYSISQFLKLQDSVKENRFIENFQNKVTDVWKSEFINDNVKFTLPSSVEKICFVNNKKNLQIHNKNPPIIEKTIDHIDIESTLNGNSSLCIRTPNQKVELNIIKEYGAELVIIKK